MKLCKICSNSIDEIRLEILPNTDTCAACVNKKLYIKPQPTEYISVPGTHFDELAVKNMQGSRSRNQKAFTIRQQKNKKTATKKPPQIAGLKKKVKQLKGQAKNVKLIKVVYQGTDTTYTYSVGNFCKKFFVDKDQARIAMIAGYIFKIKQNVMYLHRGPGDEVYIGSVKNRIKKSK